MRRTWSWMLTILVALTVGNALAADERFAVEVNVDVTDADASQAREKAMSAANRAAFTEVCKRVTTTEGAARMAEMSDAQLVNFIKEVSVIDEKSSSIRYIANLRVVLNEDMLREYMRERQIPLLMQSNTRILVVPLFREFASDAPMLWEENNLWRQAWENAPQGSGVTFIPLTRNGENYSLIDAAKAETADGIALEKLMRFNGANEVYVLDAVYDGIDGLIVKATSYRGDSHSIRVPGLRSSGKQLFEDAVKAVETRLVHQAKQQTLQESQQENQVVMLFMFSTLRQWVDAEKELRSIPYVKRLEIQAMGTNKVQFKLVYAGVHDKLLYALNGKGFSVKQQGNFVILERQ